MSSVISNDKGAKCSLCGGVEFKQYPFSKKLKITVARCKCGGDPEAIRIRRNVPVGENGESMRIEIRHNDMGERLVDMDEAKHVARAIDYEIKNGKFDPNKYRPKSMVNHLIFKNYVSQKYLPAQSKRFEKGEISKGTHRKKVTHSKLLIDFFGEKDITKITRGDVMEFRDDFKSGPRTRDLYVSELNFILNFALERDIPVKKPIMPKITAAGIEDVETFLSEDEQKKVFEQITDPLYKIMIQFLVMYALRPSEVRAIKWSDLNFKDEIISITQSFSDGTYLQKGRKSNKKVHYLPMTESFLEIISEIPRSINKDSFVFEGKIGATVNERALRTAWHNACKAAKVRRIKLYVGTKHSKLTALGKKGYSTKQLMLLSGHTTEKTLARYSQIAMSTKLETVAGMIQ